MAKTCLTGNGDLMGYLKVEEKLLAMSKVFDDTIKTLD